MTRKFYLDTCIWRDYFEDRKDRFRPLGEWAFRLIKSIIENEDEIVYSELIIEELKEYYSEEDINQVFSIVPPSLLVKIQESAEDTEKAMHISKRQKIPRKDALHAILAEKSSSTLVTRDKHFWEISDQIDIRKPEDLI